VYVDPEITALQSSMPVEFRRNLANALRSFRAAPVALQPAECRPIPWNGVRDKYSKMLLQCCGTAISHLV